MVSSETDETLMERFCEGDTKALETLFDRHAGGVQGFLKRMVRDGALAEDLLQTTFLSVVRSADRYRRGAPVWPWLLTIAANAARDALRRSRMNIEVLGEETQQQLAVAEQAEPSDPAVRRRIEAAFASLPVQQREAVLMHKVHGLSFEQIADALDITSTAARIRAHRGYEKLRELLGDLAP
jgi:RNA polymerase sigma factor (sigma-70 family)